MFLFLYYSILHSSFFSLGFYVHITLFFEYFFSCLIHRTHHETFKKFYIPENYFERLPMTGTNESK